MRIYNWIMGLLQVFLGIIGIAASVIGYGMINMWIKLAVTLILSIILILLGVDKIVVNVVTKDKTPMSKRL